DAGGTTLRHAAFVVGLALCASAIVPFTARGAWRTVAPRRVLSKEDAQRATDLVAKANALSREGKFTEARGPIGEIVELYTRVLGRDHFDTADARRELATLDKLAGLPEADRAEYRKTYVLSDEVGGFLKEIRYADALQRAEQILDIRRRLLGPDS